MNTKNVAIGMAPILLILTLPSSKFDQARIRVAALSQYFI